jgi:hypothetical protein
MTVRNTIVVGAFALLCAATASGADEVGVKARIAGDGPDAKYYLAKDVDAGIAISQLHTLEYYKTLGEPTTPLGFHLKDIDTALKRVQTTIDAFERKGRILAVQYNLFVTTVEKNQIVHYKMFPDTDIKFGKDYTGPLTRVRVDDGPLKGRELYARRLVDRNAVVVSDRAWLRAPGMKAIPVSLDADAAKRYWKALAKNDQTAAAQAYIDGKFAQVALESECSIVAFSSDHLLVQVLVKDDTAPHGYWVLATIASPEPPPTK